MQEHGGQRGAPTTAARPDSTPVQRTYRRAQRAAHRRARGHAVGAVRVYQRHCAQGGETVRAVSRQQAAAAAAATCGHMAGCGTGMAQFCALAPLTRCLLLTGAPKEAGRAECRAAVAQPERCGLLTESARSSQEAAPARSRNGVSSVTAVSGTKPRSRAVRCRHLCQLASFLAPLVTSDLGPSPTHSPAGLGAALRLAGAAALSSLADRNSRRVWVPPGRPPGAADHSPKLHDPSPAPRLPALPLPFTVVRPIAMQLRPAAVGRPCLRGLSLAPAATAAAPCRRRARQWAVVPSLACSAQPAAKAGPALQCQPEPHAAAAAAVAATRPRRLAAAPPAGVPPRDVRANAKAASAPAIASAAASR